MPQKPSLILASSSPYRKELLSRLRLPFIAISPDVNETPQPGEAPEALALRLSVGKAMAVAARQPGSIVIGSDQVATVDGAPIGKPGDFLRAQAQLRALSGQLVEFHSALAVTDGQREEKADIITRCRFRQLPDHQHTPVLLVTGVAISAEQATELADLQAVVMSKPLEPSQFLAEVGQLVHARCRPRPEIGKNDPARAV